MRTDVAVVGAGQAGLALSRCLVPAGIDHVLIERGRVAERWRSETWDSLRLLSPNWMTRLPGWRYEGPDPDGFMRRDEVVAFLSAYARSFDAPVIDGAAVERVTREGAGFRVETSSGTVRARAVVIATGQCDRPRVPAIAARIDPAVTQIHASRYRSADRLPPGGVLVVGASSSGAQVADELARAGRDVVLSVGRHTRLPRNWRGRDVFWWMERTGMLDEPVEAMADRDAAWRQPSLQLVGRPDRSDLDIGTLKALGVRLAGRLADVEGRSITFADDLEATVASADAKLERLVDRFEAGAAAIGPDLPEAERPRAIRPGPGIGRLALGEGIDTIVWATGYGRGYEWLAVPALRPDGEIDHRGGVTRVPGLYALGLRLLRRRNSNFIDGVGADAAEIARHIGDELNVGRLEAA